MTDTFAPSAHPPWAVVAWCDDRAIYIELPCVDGPPYVTKYDLTEGGLSKALRLMRDARRKLAKPSISGDFDVAKHPKIQRATATRKSTVEQRAKARDILRKIREP